MLNQGCLYQHVNTFVSCYLAKGGTWLCGLHSLCSHQLMQMANVGLQKWSSSWDKRNTFFKHRNKRYGRFVAVKTTERFICSCVCVRQRTSRPIWPTSPARSPSSRSWSTSWRTASGGCTRSNSSTNRSWWCCSARSGTPSWRGTVSSKTWVRQARQSQHPARRASASGQAGR